MVAIPSPGGQFPVTNGAVPCEGTKAFPFLLDFTGGKNAYVIDLTAQFQQKQFTTMQTAFVDNSANTDTLEIICNTTNQVIVCPALSQGYYALLSPSPPKLQVQTNGGLILEIILLNFYIPPEVWIITPVSAGGLPEVDIPALDAAIVNNHVQVDAFAGTVTAPTDASGVTNVAGGTPDMLFVANPTRKRWTLSNPSVNTANISFSYVSNVGGYIDLPPGSTWNEADLSVSGDEIWVKSPANSTPFTAYSWG